MSTFIASCLIAAALFGFMARHIFAPRGQTKLVARTALVVISLLLGGIGVWEWRTLPYNETPITSYLLAAALGPTGAAIFVSTESVRPSWIRAVGGGVFFFLGAMLGIAGGLLIPTL